MKFYGLLNGFFYVFYGLYGVLAPRHLAESTMGWAPTLLGLHQIRALWMVSIGFGIICIYAALKGNLSALTKGHHSHYVLFSAGPPFRPCAGRRRARANLL
jgi:purine-cytosine permease-like protein